jgi:hypothetical protein
VANIDERQLGPGRTAIVRDDAIRAIQRGPLQLRLSPPRGPIDAVELLEAVASLGVDVAGIAPETIAHLNARLPALMEQLLDDEEAAAVFDRDPAAFRDVLGDELADTLVLLRQRVMGMRSAISPPGSDESTRRPARRSTSRLVTARDPEVEARADALRRELIKWAVARRPNMAALARSPRETIERHFPDAPEAVRRALLREVERAGGADA